MLLVFFTSKNRSISKAPLNVVLNGAYVQGGSTNLQFPDGPRPHAVPESVLFRL